MKKSKVLILLVFVFMIILGFYIWRFYPFLPHITRNTDGSFTYNNITYVESNNIEEFSNLKRGKKIAIINKFGEFPKCSVYETKGNKSNDILIVYPEIIMSVDTYYVRQ